MAEFSAMLNQHIPKKKKILKEEKPTSIWTKMAGKK